MLSGVYFGDKLSPLSDSVELASTMSNVDVVEHIKGMLPISLISYVITAVLFTVVGLQYSGNVSLEQVNLVMEALDNQFNITPLAIVPVVLVLGLIWAIAFQGMDPRSRRYSRLIVRLPSPPASTLSTTFSVAVAWSPCWARSRSSSSVWA